MDFTREPVVETVITPRDGYRIVVRSSKSPGQEEYVVEALEVVTFGHTCFFRHLERPKAFVVPASDYEVFEVREPRLALKAASFEGVVRTSTVREPAKPMIKEVEKKEEVFDTKDTPSFENVAIEEEVKEEEPETPAPPAAPTDGRQDRRREKRRNLRRRKGREEQETRPREEKSGEGSKTEAAKPQVDKEVIAVPVMTNILPPPTTLIRDNLQKLREVEQRGAIYLQAEEPLKEEREEDDDDAPVVPLSLQEEPMLASPEVENLYKASPAPTDDESPSSLWGGGFSPASSDQRSRPS